MSGTLAIDTASKVVAVAFRDGATVTVRTSDDETQEHSRRIVELIDAVTGGDRTAVARIVVARGPGSFTGLRIGIATAESLGFALGVPVLGVDTLQLVALAAENAEVIAVHPAGRGEFATQRFTGGEPDGDFRLAKPEELDHIGVVGEGAKELGGREIGAADRVRQAVDLTVPPDSGPSVEPLYARAPNITKPKAPFAPGGAAV